MTMVAVKGGLFMPPYYNRLSLGFAVNNPIGTIDAAGERVGVVFQAPKTGNIDRLLFRTVGGSTSQSLSVALEGVSTSTGFPDGTDYGGSAPGTQASFTNNTLYEVTLATAGAVTLGDVLAAVIDWSGTAGVMGWAGCAGARDTNQGFPYGVLYTTSWAKQSDMNLTPVVGVRYDDGTYEWVGGVIAGVHGTSSYNNASTPDEIGNKYVLAAPMRCAGFWLGLSPASGATFDAVLYDSSDNVLASVSVDPDQLQGVGNYKLINMRWAPVELAIGSYRFVLKPTSANNLSYSDWSVGSNAQLDCGHIGSAIYRTSRTDAGAWTDSDAAQVQGMGLWFDQIDDGAGAVGGVGPHILTPVGGGGAYY